MAKKQANLGFVSGGGAVVMEEQFLPYLEKVTRHSGLSKREQAEWIEEMSAHLYEEVLNLMGSGYEEKAAIEIALQKFGEPSVVRKKISRETFGFSVSTIYILAFISLVLFFLGVYLNQLNYPYEVSVGVPQKPWYPNPWLYFFTSILPLSPSLMIALFINFILLFKTHRKRDRMSLFLTLVIFGLLWILWRLPLPPMMNQMVMAVIHPSTMEPWFSFTLVVFVIWGLSLYRWTKNRWMSISPMLISFAVGLWFPLLNVFQTMMSIVMSIRLLGGSIYAPDPFVPVMNTGVARAIQLVILLVLFKVFDWYQGRRKRSVAN